MSRLVLTRKENEAVIIQKDGIVIASLKVSRIDRNQVRLAFEAELDVQIDRDEVYNSRKPIK
jgi:carbon storage regulator CsrA